MLWNQRAGCAHKLQIDYPFVLLTRNVVHRKRGNTWSDDLAIMRSLALRSTIMVLNFFRPSCSNSTVYLTSFQTLPSAKHPLHLFPLSDSNFQMFGEGWRVDTRPHLLGIRFVFCPLPPRRWLLPNETEPMAATPFLSYCVLDYLVEKNPPALCVIELGATFVYCMVPLRRRSILSCSESAPSAAYVSYVEP